MKTVAKLFLAACLVLSGLAVSSAQFMDQQTYSTDISGSGNAIGIWISNWDSSVPGVPLRFVPTATNTGATTLAVSGGSDIPVLKPTSTGPRALVGGEIRSGQAVVVMFDGSNFLLLSAPYSLNPNRQYLTSGTGATYTTPAGATSLFVQMIGGGGGGASGGNGGATSFNSVTAAGGSGASGGSGANGGTGGTGTAQLRLRGGDGSTVYFNASGGGSGGSGYFGGAGHGAGSSRVGGTNTGGGGGGGSDGGGGGSGEYVELVISNPSSTYTYTIGAAGTSSGGSIGGSGLIIVIAYFN